MATNPALVQQASSAVPLARRRLISARSAWSGTGWRVWRG